MKNIIITPKRQKCELLTLLACFVIACLLNLYSILKYGGKVSELITSLGYVLVFTLVLYIAWTAVRIAWALMMTILKKKK